MKRIRELLFSWELSFLKKTKKLLGKTVLLAVILSGLPGMLFAQTQPVTLDVKEADVQTVFQQIKEQTGLNFVYNADQLREMPRITLHAKEEPVNSVLSRIFKNTPFEYRFEEGIVIVKKKTKTISTSKRVVGFVTDKKGSPLPGVTVQVIGTSVGTATNEKGWFAITLPMLTGKLKFSFVGYKDQNAEFTESSDTLRIYLEENIEELDEAVVVAYGTTTRRETTGSISVVKAEELKGIPATSISGLLQGRVAGMDITQMSGSPGGGGTAVVIRGYNSFDVEQGRRFSDPLWVVDGVPLNAFDSPVTGTNLLSDINPDMIESIQILKDASAASLYGSRAANGVIIVTTKKGKRNSKATFSANVSHSWSWVHELPTITVGKAERYARLLALANTKTAYLNPDTQTWTYPTSNKEVFDYKDGSFDYFFTATPGSGSLALYQDSLNSFYNNQTNFFPTYFRTGKVVNANLQTYGGGEEMSYGIGLGFYDESGVFVGTGFQRVDLNSSLNVTPVERLNVDLRMNASLITRKRGEKTDQMGYAPSIETVPGDPYWESSLYPGEGTAAWQATLDALRGTKEKNRSVRLRTNFKVGYDIIDGLNVSALLAADYSIHRRNYFQPSYLNEDGFSSSIGETSINLMVLNEDIISWQKTFRENHNVSLMVGFSYQYDQMEYNGGEAQNSPSDKIYYAPAGMPDLGYIDQWGQQVPVAFQHYQSNMQEKKMFSFFGRLEYNYKKKYLFTLSYRRDGSSVFGKDCHWGTFPSIAAGWTFSEENLIKNNVGWLSFGKFRASWGRSGKPFEYPYLALGLMVGGEYSEYGNPTLEPSFLGSGLYNNDLSWEETDQYDLGVDIDFFNYRLGMTLDYYYRYTDKLLFSVALPGDYNGYLLQWRNAGAISNEGIELLVKYEILRNADFYWKVSVNGAKNWNRVEKSENKKDLAPTLITGKPLNRIQGYLTDGLINNQEDVPATFSGNEKSYLYPEWDKNSFYTLGDYKFVDVNGDGSITSIDIVSLGSALPIISGGLVNDFQWRNFDLSLVMHYSIGRHMVNQLEINALSFAPDPTSKYYAHPLLLNWSDFSFWEETGDKTSKYPLYQVGGKHQYGEMFFPMDWQVEKVNYLKLKTVTIGYNLPEQLTRHCGLSQVRVFLTGENLWTWTNYSGIDPETVSIKTGLDPGLNYPLARKFTLGLTVKF